VRRAFCRRRGPPRWRLRLRWRWLAPWSRLGYAFRRRLRERGLPLSILPGRPRWRRPRLCEPKDIRCRMRRGSHMGLEPSGYLGRPGLRGRVYDRPALALVFLPSIRDGENQEAAIHEGLLPSSLMARITKRPSLAALSKAAPAAMAGVLVCSAAKSFVRCTAGLRGSSPHAPLLVIPAQAGIRFDQKKNGFLFSRE
jgi:hypothetical protein